jgi:gentisate 1,2-dioxygenase
MPTVRAEFHRLLAGTRTPSRRDVGSAVWQVFDGSGEIHVADQQWAVQRGDVVVVPSWAPWSIHADSTLDLFTFSDAPVIERLRFARHFVEPVTE